MGTGRDCSHAVTSHKARGCFGRLRRGAAACCAAICHHPYKHTGDLWFLCFPKRVPPPPSSPKNVVCAFGTALQRGTARCIKGALSALGLSRAARCLLASCFMLPQSFVLQRRNFFSKGGTSLPTALSRWEGMVHVPASSRGATVLPAAASLCLLTSAGTAYPCWWTDAGGQISFLVPD